MFNRIIVYTTNDVKQSVLLEDTVKNAPRKMIVDFGS